MNRVRLLRRSLWHRIEAIALIAALILTLCASSYVIAGREGVLAIAVALTLTVVLGPRAQPAIVLRLFRTVSVTRWQAPEAYAISARLAQRAGLAAAPVLHWLPARGLNALAVGDRHRSAVALSDSMFRTLSLRELAGVLGHEISHLSAGDPLLLAIAEMIRRVLVLTAWLGLALLAVLGPPILNGGGGGDRQALSVGVLLAAPAIAFLLQRALSRSREFAADLRSAELTGDPGALADALAKVEAVELPRPWLRALRPFDLASDTHYASRGGLFATHPSTADRIRRLNALQHRGSSVR